MPGPPGPQGPQGSPGATGPAGSPALTGPPYILVGDKASGNVYIIDPSTNEIVCAVQLGDINGLNSDCALRKLFVVSADGTVLTIVGCDSGQVLASIPLLARASAATAVIRPAVNTNNHMVYVPVPGAGSLAVVNGIHNMLTDTIAVGGIPVAAAVSQRTNLVYVANNTSEIPVVNSNNNQVFTQISLPAGVNCNDVMGDSCANKVYAQCSDGSIAVINGATNTVEETIHPPGGSSALVVDQSLGLLYVVDLVRCNVMVYDSCTLQQIGTLAIPTNAQTNLAQIAVNFLTHLVYVLDLGNNTTFVVDGGLNKVVSQLPVGGNVIGALNCDNNCPVCVNVPCCGCSNDNESAAEHAMGLFTRMGTEQAPKNRAFVRFEETQLNEGEIARAMNEEHLQMLKAGVYEIHMRIPMRTKQVGCCYLHYGLQVNDNIVAEDELFHAGGRERLRASYLHHYERLSPGDILGVPITGYQSDHQQSDMLKCAYFSIRKVG